MSKIFSLTLGICLLAGTALAQSNQPYVRKKIQPNFFIPKGALSEDKPEKVGIPQYRQGVSTAKRVSARTSDITQTPTSVPQNNKNKENVSPISNQEPTLSAEENTSMTPLVQTIPTEETNISETLDTNTPNYQQMYQDYLKDLDYIAKSGKISDQNITKDLKAMNSEKRIKIDQKFNSQRDVKKDILEALKQ